MGLGWLRVCEDKGAPGEITKTHTPHFGEGVVVKHD